MKLILSRLKTAVIYNKKLISFLQSQNIVKKCSFEEFPLDQEESFRKKTLTT